MISDIHTITELVEGNEIKNFDMWGWENKFFTPYQQLMTILPPYSIERLLPKDYSQIYQLEEMRNYYPLDFNIDLNGRSTPWEAIILIPFVNEEKLFQIEKRLSDEGKL